MKTFYNSVFKILSIFMIGVALTLSTPLQAQAGGNADGTSTGETGFNITEGTNSTGGNCGNGPHTHAGNAICPNKKGTSIPLDGGLSILVLGAAAFGIRKLRNK